MGVLQDRLKEIRKENRLTYKQIAQRLGHASHTTYANWEYGNRNPDKDALTAVGQAFNVSVDWLLGLTDDRTPRDADTQQLEQETLELVKDIRSLPEDKRNHIIDLIRLFKSDS